MAAFEAEAFEEIGDSNEFPNEVDTKGKHKDETTNASLVVSRNALPALLALANARHGTAAQRHSLRTLQEVHQVVAQLVSGQHVLEAEVGTVPSSCRSCHCQVI